MYLSTNYLIFIITILLSFFFFINIERSLIFENLHFIKMQLQFHFYGLRTNAISAVF